MCEQAAGAAGTPRAPANYRFLQGFSHQGGCFRRPDGIRLRYEWTATGYGQDTNRIRLTSTCADRPDLDPACAAAPAPGSTTTLVAVAPRNDHVESETCVTSASTMAP
jgi:hypothetical protein